MRTAEVQGGSQVLEKHKPVFCLLRARATIPALLQPQQVKKLSMEVR